MSDQYNPIQTVDGVAIPSPSKYKYKLSDISGPDAGRTEDGLMHKERITGKVHLELTWDNLGDGDAHAILSAFQPEYFSVKYYDYRTQDFQIKTFYAGDREVDSYNRVMQIGTIAFNIIEQ